MALTTHKLTESGDIELNSLSQPVTLRGKEAAEQMVVSAISLWRGNWFADLDRGVDWLRIAKKLYTKTEIIQIFQQAVLKLSIVDEVLDLFIRVGSTDGDPTLTRTATMTYLIVVDGEKVDGSVQL